MEQFGIKKQFPKTVSISAGVAVRRRKKMEYKWTVLTVTTVGVLMAGVDARIIIVGIPQVAAALHADAEEAIWFTQSFVLGTTLTLLLIGRITDIFGRIRVYNLGFIIFTVGSALTSLSQDPLQVIIFRGIQGFGSAALFANSVSIIVDSTPRKELGFSLGLNQIAFRFGAMAGLTISGMILSILDWRALFYINIPIGIFGTVWSHARLKEVAKLERGAPVDWIGFATFTASLGSFLLALTFSAYGALHENSVYVLLFISAVSLLFFVLYERRCEYPLLDLTLFGSRQFTGGIVALMLNAMAWGAVLLVLSLYFQLVQGLTPFQAGIRIIPVDIAFLLVGPLSGRLSDRFGQKPFTTVGIILTSLALFLFSRTGVGTPYPDLVVFMALLGAGVGAFSSPNISSIMNAVPAHRRGIASAVRATLFNVGFALSLNITILLMAAVMPFNSITEIIIAPDVSLIPDLDRQLFVHSLQNAYIWLAMTNGVALIPTLLGGIGRRHTPRIEAAESPN